MKKRIIAKKLWGIMKVFSLISLAVILFPISFLIKESIRGILNLVIGLLFWIGLIGGIVAYFRLYKKCRLIIYEALGQCRLSLLVFFSNPVAKVVDTIFVVSIIANIAFLTIVNPPIFFIWLGIFTFVTSFYLHFLFNGRIFKYIITK